MKIVILRKDSTWTIKARPNIRAHVLTLPPDKLQQIRQRFHEIAHQHGSHATWLPETGFLVTDDCNEPARNYPYESWLEEAFRVNEAGYPSLQSSI